MRRFSRVFVISAFFFTAFLVPRASHAYIGVGLGTVDESNFGYALTFGGGLFSNFGIDAGLNGFFNSDAGVDTTWVQGHADLYYDFNFLWKKVSESFELHPLIKGGFTYGSAWKDGGGFNQDATYGPGYNFGAVIDWKLLPFMTVGIDLTEHVIYLSAVTVSGVTLGQERTAHSFNCLAMVKFFAY